MDNKIVVRPINESELKEFYEHYSMWVMSLFPDYSESLRRRFIEKIFNKHFIAYQLKNGIVLAAFFDKRIVGLLVAKGVYGGIGYCVWLMVDDKFQRKGIGKTLLEYWEEWVKKQGGHGLMLETDQRNVEFYKKMGFELIGLHKNGYWGTDNYYFQKTIAEPKEENFLK